MRGHLQAVWVEVECRRAGWHRINFYSHRLRILNAEHVAYK